MTTFWINNTPYDINETSMSPEPEPTINLQQKTITNEENGQTIVTPDTGYDGLSTVTINTEVPEPLKLASISTHDSYNIPISLSISNLKLQNFQPTTLTGLSYSLFITTTLNTLHSAIYSFQINWQGNDMLATTSTPIDFTPALTISYKTNYENSTGGMNYFISPNEIIKRAELFIDNEEYKKYIWYDQLSQSLPTPTLKKFNYLTFRNKDSTTLQINLTTLTPIETQPEELIANYTTIAYNK